MPQSIFDSTTPYRKIIFILKSKDDGEPLIFNVQVERDLKKIIGKSMPDKSGFYNIHLSSVGGINFINTRDKINNYIIKKCSEQELKQFGKLILD